MNMYEIQKTCSEYLPQYSRIPAIEYSEYLPRYSRNTCKEVLGIPTKLFSEYIPMYSQNPKENDHMGSECLPRYTRNTYQGILGILSNRYSEYLAQYSRVLGIPPQAFSEYPPYVFSESPPWYSGWLAHADNHLFWLMPIASKMAHADNLKDGSCR